MVSKTDVKISTKGWNWGNYELADDELEFKVDGQRCFGIRYKDIGLSSENGKNEVALEFQQDTEEGSKNAQGDILCEMRFHVPNNELDIYREQKATKLKEERKKKKESKKEEKKPEEDGSQQSDSDDVMDDDDMTAAKLFNSKIRDKSNIGEFAGENVCSIQEIPMLIPRGNYGLDFYSNFIRLHGKTRDFKIQFKDIQQIIMLEKPDAHMVYVLHLNQPLRQGMTLHHFVALNFEVKREELVTIKLTPEEIKAKYGDSLKPEIEGKLYDVLSTLFINLVGIRRIIMPGDFKSARGYKAVKCSVKAAEGFFFPMKSSIVFIHKPVMYIRHSEVKHVEFSRVGQGAANQSRNFDITLTKTKDDSTTTFISIDKEEQKVLINYFKSSGIKVRVLKEEGGNKVELVSDLDSEDEAGSAAAAGDREAGKRRVKKKDISEIEMDMDDESSEDEDFVEGESGSGDDDEEGEAEESGEEDMSQIDEDVDKAELKAIQSGVDLTGGRPKRNRGGDKK